MAKSKDSAVTGVVNVDAVGYNGAVYIDSTRIKKFIPDNLIGCDLTETRLAYYHISPPITKYSPDWIIYGSKFGECISQSLLTSVENLLTVWHVGRLRCKYWRGSQ